VLQPVHIADVDQETTCSHKGHGHISERAPDDAVHLCATYDEVARQLIGPLQFGYLCIDHSYLLVQCYIVTCLTLFSNKGIISGQAVEFPGQKVQNYFCEPPSVNHVTFLSAKNLLIKYNEKWLITGKNLG
jgi:hypothetical protein